MFALYPRLPLIQAADLAREYAFRPVAELAAISTAETNGLKFAPTGGNRVERSELEALRGRVLGCARKAGYPERLHDAAAAEFDYLCAASLHWTMHLHPSEAAHLEVWAFLTCMLLPDVVRWRFPGGADGTSEDRYIGGDRGLRRNTFGRLWWRAHLFQRRDQRNPYELLSRLKEDELVQMTERTSLAANTNLLSQFSDAFLSVIDRDMKSAGQGMRRDVLRDSVKRLRRLLPIVGFELLDNSASAEVVADVVTETTKALAGKAKD